MKILAYGSKGPNLSSYRQLIMLLLLNVGFLTVAKAQESKTTDIDFPPLDVRYFGEEPPGLIPKLFAPDVVSPDGLFEGGSYSPDMKNFYFSRKNGKYKERTFFVIQYENERWINEQETEIRYPRYSRDGTLMYKGNQYRERTESGWSELKSMGSPFTDKHIMGISVSDQGTFFFDEFERPDTVGAISFSRLMNGRYQTREKMGPEINTGTWIAHPLIAHDESYLIWDVQRADGYGGSDIYISFKLADDSWLPAVNMGDQINTRHHESGASISPDGKYLFFSRGEWKSKEDGSTYWIGKPYWVDVQVIQHLREKYVAKSSGSTSLKIAYGSNGICLADEHGKHQKRLTLGDHGYPAWSPDGKRIVYYGYYDDKKTWSIHTVNSDGSDAKRLTHTRFKWDNMPSWSPDGKNIVFAREYRDSEDVWHPEIWIMNADGGEERQLEALRGGGPCFLPDGRLVFHSEHEDKESEISIADIGGGKVIHLTENEAEEWDPKISPDGTQIAFTSDRDGNHEVYVMNVDGSNQTRLTFNDVDDYGPSWSPDGRLLVFQSKRDGSEHSGLYIMEKDGSSVKKIVDEGWQPAWYQGSR